MNTEHKPIPRFNPHGATCKGHANYMLDCEFTDPVDRKAMIAALDSAIESYEKVSLI